MPIDPDIQPYLDAIGARLDLLEEAAVPGLAATLSVLDSRLDTLEAGGFGAKGDGVADDTAAIQAAIDAVAPIVNGVIGGTVALGKGTFLVSQTIRLPNYVRLVGAGENATRIKAAPGFPAASSVVKLGPSGSGNGDVYGVTLENLRVDCSQIPGSVGVEMNDCNEHCALVNVEVRNFDGKAVYITASAHCTLDRVAANGFPTSGALHVIHLSSCVGPIWMRSIGNVSTGRTPPLAGSAGVRVENAQAHIFGLHAERVEHGVHFAAGWGGSVVGAAGHSSVTNVVTVDNAHPGSVACVHISQGGAARTVLDTTTEPDTAKGGVVGRYP